MATSTITATDADIESTSSIHIMRDNSNYRHTITYSFGNLSGTILTKTNLTGFGWNVPSSFYAQIPNAKSGTVTLTCITYNGNTEIGTATTTLTVTASEVKCKPAVSGTVVDTNSDTISATGNANNLVKYASTAQVTPNVIAKNSATISSIKVNGQSVGQGSAVVFWGVTDETFEIIATDSRGYSNSYTLSPTVIQYVPLTISAKKIARTTATSSTAKISISGNWFNGNFGNGNNTLTIRADYRLKGSDMWTYRQAITPTINNNTFYINNATIDGSYPYTNAYEFLLTVADKVSTIKIIIPLGKGVPFYDYGIDSSSNNYFNVNGTLYENNKSLLDLTYPVGSIYMSVNSTSPATLFGGSWTQIKNRFLFGQGVYNNGATGGYYTHSHTTGDHVLTISEIPEHSHNVPNSHPWNVSSTSHISLLQQSNSYLTEENLETDAVGGGNAHNHGDTGETSSMPPYLVVYMWKRTA